mgnify:CR=1 FL=1
MIFCFVLEDVIFLIVIKKIYFWRTSVFDNEYIETNDLGNGRKSSHLTTKNKCVFILIDINHSLYISLNSPSKYITSNKSQDKPFRFMWLQNHFTNCWSFSLFFTLHPVQKDVKPLTHVCPQSHQTESYKCGILH